jgi:two-component system chemotaxis response regulator CheB
MMNAAPRTRVLIVDDSRTNAAFLSALFEADRELEVIGIVNDGASALTAARRLKPHVITMDIDMPRLDGFEATRQIMESQPVPIVIVSASTLHNEVAANFRALEAGALALVFRPPGPSHLDHELCSQYLVRTVKAMAGVKVVRRWHRRETARGFATATPIAVSASGSVKSRPRVIGIGASTGGPIVLQSILSRLRPTLPVPVLIVQHMAPGFSGGFVDWLTHTTKFPVSVARQGETLAAGRAYIAPDGAHLGIRDGLEVFLSAGPLEGNMRPSVSFLFRSIAETCGAHCAAVLLTGMGRDGVDELKVLRDLGALTLVQNEETSVVFGMPGQAVLAGAAEKILNPDEIAAALNQLSFA